MNPPAADSPFVPTRWTLVLRSRGQTPEARAALSELCGTYYQPVLRFLCRDGRDPETARELTQEFFARVLQRGDLGPVDPQKGRFRSYLLGAVKHFLADQRKRERRDKRGGGIVPDSLDAAADGERSWEPADPRGPVPDAWFDREWALTVMARALDALEGEFKAAGRGDQFACLQPWLAGDTGVSSQAEVAGRLGLTEGAVKVAIHRLRKRFREIVRNEVGQTVDSDGEVDAELRYLVEVLAAG